MIRTIFASTAATLAPRSARNSFASLFRSLLMAVVPGLITMPLRACRLLTRGFGSRDECDAVCCGELGEFWKGLDVCSGRLDDVPALVQERPDLALGLGDGAGDDAE